MQAVLQLVHARRREAKHRHDAGADDRRRGAGEQHIERHRHDHDEQHTLARHAQQTQQTAEHVEEYRDVQTGYRQYMRQPQLRELTEQLRVEILAYAEDKTFHIPGLVTRVQGIHAAAERGAQVSMRPSSDAVLQRGPALVCTAAAPLALKSQCIRWLFR